MFVSIQNEHRRSLVCFLFVCVIVVIQMLSGCSTSRFEAKENQSVELRKLHWDFLEADALERTSLEVTKWNELKRRILKKLERLGDEKFAGSLSNEDSDVQVSVVNCIGLLQSPQYDRYQKTRNVLSAAPKI